MINDIGVPVVFPSNTPDIIFTKSFIEKTKKLKIGDGLKEGTNLGPITTKKRLEEIEKLVEKT